MERQQSYLEQPADRELEGFFRVSPATMCIVGPDGRFVRVNPSFERYVGVAERDLLSLAFVEFVHADDRESTSGELQKVLKGRRTARFENRYRCRDGSYRWLSWTCAAGEDGECIYAVGCDVTDRKKVSELLEESRRRYQQLLEAGATYRYSVEMGDGRPRSTWHSQESLAATGYEPEEFRADPYLWFRMVHPDDRAAVQRHVARILADESVPPIEHRIVRKNGDLRWVRDTVIVHRDEAGRLVRYDGLVEDITDRKQVEERVRKLTAVAADVRGPSGEQKKDSAGDDAPGRLQSMVSDIVRTSLEPISLDDILQGTLDLLLAGAFPGNHVLEPRGAIFAADDESQKLVLKAHRGLAAEQLTGCSQLPLRECPCARASENQHAFFNSAAGAGAGACHADEHPEGQFCVPIVSSGRAYGVIRLYLRGGHRPLAQEESFFRAVADLMAGIIRRKLGEEALRRSEERFDLAVRGTDAGIWDWDLRTDAVYFSPRWKGMLGFSADEMSGHFSEWEDRLHPDDRERAMATIRGYLDGRSPDYRLEHRLRHKDGSYRWILARGAAVRDSDGKPYRMVGSHVDITERKRTEERLVERTDQLARSNQELGSALAALRSAHEQLISTRLQLVQADKMELVGRLSAGIAHEVKNPLAIASLAAEYLLSRLDSRDREIVDAVRELQYAMKRADVVVQKLMRFARPSKPDLKQAALSAVIDSSLLMLKRDLALSHATVAREYAQGLPPVCIDVSSMEQVFINIFMNAMDAMPHGGKVTARLRARRLSGGDEDRDLGSGKFQPGDTIVIAEVEDSGGGIPPEMLDHVFEPFFTTKPVGKGTGLGLTVVRSIVEMHGGTIDVRNREQGGVRVTVGLKGIISHEDSEEKGAGG